MMRPGVLKWLKATYVWALFIFLSAGLYLLSNLVMTLFRINNQIIKKSS
jgi:hypothetical protein